MVSWSSLDSIHYYFDESSYEKGHKFAALGAIAVPTKFRDPIKRRLAKIKHDCGLKEDFEVKWENTGKRRDCPQTAFAKYLVHLLDYEAVNLHLVFIPFRDFEHRANGGREESVGRIFNDMLIFHPLKFYGPYSKIQFRPDEGATTENLECHLSAAVNETANRKRRNWQLANNIRSCVGSFEPRSSKRTPILQLLDVTLGAFAALRNERKNEEPKQRLAKLVHAMHGYPDLTADVGKGNPLFSIWNFKGRGPKKKTTVESREASQSPFIHLP